MTNNSKFSQAATQLLNRRVAGTKAECLDAEIRPDSIDDALAVQAEMIMQRRDPVGGWKTLLPPAEDQLVVAPIFHKRLITVRFVNCLLITKWHVLSLRLLLF